MKHPTWTMEHVGRYFMPVSIRPDGRWTKMDSRLLIVGRLSKLLPDRRPGLARLRGREIGSFQSQRLWHCCLQTPSLCPSDDDARLKTAVPAPTATPSSEATHFIRAGSNR